MSNSELNDYTFQNRNFVFTGTLSTFTRNQAMALVIERGGTVQMQITSDTDILVCGDKVGATKTRAARKWNVGLRDEAWLLAAVARTTPGLEPRRTVPSMTTAFHQRPEVKADTIVEPKVRRVRVR